MKRLLLFITSCLLLSSCVNNPVTGKRQLSIMSEAAELKLGERLYVPTQQQSGGVYKVDPDLNRYVNAIGQKLAAVSHQPNLPYEFVVINNSVPNAWAMPGGKIAINRGLLVLLKNEAELAAVLAHEIVHVTAKHSARQQDKAMMMGLGAQIINISTQNERYGNLINLGANLGGTALMSKYGRTDELDADFYGIDYMVKAGYDPEGAVELQKTFVALSKSRQSTWLSALFASHPPSQSRVQANMAKAFSINTPGMFNTQQYQTAIKQLKNDKAAYEDYDKGLKALNDGDAQQALALANKAIDQQVNESLFYELKGRALSKQKLTKKALEAFNQAIVLNDEFYSHYLHRASAYQALGNQQQAEEDFKRSAKWLPTATASYFLADIAKSRGDNQTAIQYFKAAAGSKAYTVEANTALAELLMPSQPQQYFSATFSQNNNQLLVKLNNLSFKNVDYVVAKIHYINNNKTYQKLVRFHRIPAKQESAYYKTGISTHNLAQYKIEIIEARPSR